MNASENSQKLRDRHDPATSRSDADEEAAAKQCGVAKAALKEACAINAEMMTTRAKRDEALNRTFKLYMKYHNDRKFDAFFRALKLGKPGPKSKNPCQPWVNWTFGSHTEESLRRWYGKVLQATEFYRETEKRLTPERAIKTIGGGDYTLLVKQWKVDSGQASPDLSKRLADAAIVIRNHINGVAPVRLTIEAGGDAIPEGAFISVRRREGKFLDVWPGIEVGNPDAVSVIKAMVHAIEKDMAAGEKADEPQPEFEELADAPVGPKWNPSDKEREDNKARAKLKRERDRIKREGAQSS